MRVAYFSPAPDSRSGIADYSSLLLPALDRRVDVVVARPGLLQATAERRRCALPRRQRSRRPRVDRRASFAVGLEWSFCTTSCSITSSPASRSPAGTRSGTWMRDGTWARPGGAVARVRRSRQQDPSALGDTSGGVAARRGDPAAGDGIVAHSRVVKDGSREAGFDGPIWRIPHPAWPSPNAAPAEIAGTPLVGCFGHLNEAKRIPQLLRAFSLFRLHRPDASLVLVGRPSSGSEALRFRRAPAGSTSTSTRSGSGR